jgi:hypothetical protein
MAHQWRTQAAPSLLRAYSHFSWRKLRAIENRPWRVDGAYGATPKRHAPA